MAMLVITRWYHSSLSLIFSKAGCGTPLAPLHRIVYRIKAGEGAEQSGFMALGENYMGGLFIADLFDWEWNINNFHDDSWW